MSCRGARTLSALIAIAVAAGPSAAQSSTGVGELLARARNAINDLRYGEAAITSRQVLATGSQLNRQQTIDALQILAAAVYPEGGAVQRPDSAKAVMRRLIAMGVRGGMARDLAWRGIDSLFGVVLRDSLSTSTRLGAAELTLRDSVSHVVTLLANRVDPVEIVDRVRFDCYTVQFDSLDSAIQQARAPAALSLALQATCTRLAVESEMPTGTVSVGMRRAGLLVNGRGAWWVDPADSAVVLVAGADGQVSTRTTLPRGKAVHARFSSAVDTMPWPEVRTAVAIAESLGLFAGWSPPGRKPSPPNPPKPGRSFKAKLVWGLFGAAAGYGLGLAIPTLSCSATLTVPPGEVWIVDGQPVGPGSTTKGPGSVAACAGAMAGMGLTTYFLASLGRGSSPAAQRRYQEALAGHAAIVREWEINEKRRYAEAHPRVRQAMNAEQATLTRVKAQNATILGRRGQGPVAQIIVEDLPGALVASMGGLPSDVDIVIPKAAAANAGAVAVVIGNHAYANGISRPDFAVRDAVTMSRYLEESFGISRERVLLDSNTTSARMGQLLGTQSNESEWALAEMVASRPPNSVDVIVYFSGLATTDANGKNLLLPIDATAERLSALGFSTEQLYRNLQALNARSVTVIVEAAFSGATEDGQVHAGRDPVTVPEGALRPRGANIDAFFAASAGQPNRGRRDQTHGLFSYFLLKGLGGAADANRDLKVTAGELDDYIKLQLRSYLAERGGNNRQTPDVFIGNRARTLVTLQKR